MKRPLKLISIFLLFVILLCSCESNHINDIESDTTSSENSQFIYTLEGAKIVRYDVIEQKEIIACPDPFCEHDSYECPVSDVSSKVHFTNDYIAFVKEGNFTEAYYYPYATLYLYDLEEGTITIILKDASQIYYPWISANREYVFFTAAVLLFDENGNSTGEIWHVYRYNIESGELETINGGESITRGYLVVEDTGSTLVWNDSLKATYFTSDYDFENIEEYDYIGETVCGYYIYSDIKWTEYDDYYRTVYKEDIESGEVEQILDNVSEMRYDDAYSPSGIAYTGFNYNEDYSYNAKSEIWYYDFETGESRLLIDVKDISDDFDYVRIQGHTGYNDSAGGYMMVSIGHTVIKTDDDGDKYMSADYTHRLFINPETGDWFIMEPLY